MDNSNWSVQDENESFWYINRNGRNVGSLAKEKATREEAISIWRSLYEHTLEDEGQVRRTHNDMVHPTQSPVGAKDVSNPDYYHVGGLEAINIIEAKLTRNEFIGACKANIMKYIMRANYKGHHDNDCRKAAWYANKLEEAINGEEEEFKEFLDPPF